jgi:hypothetical protein
MYVPERASDVQSLRLGFFNLFFNFLFHLQVDPSQQVITTIDPYKVSPPDVEHVLSKQS